MYAALVYGRYRFARKKIAYRSDFCLTCGQPRLAERFRTFDALHLFFIPVVPLGFWKHWHCTACGQNPHRRVITSAAIRTLIVSLLLVLSVCGWAIPLSDPTSFTANDRVGFWVMRIAPLIPLPFLIKSIMKREYVATLHEGLAEIDSLSAETCFYCHGALDSAAHCSRCELTREIATT